MCGQTDGTYSHNIEKFIHKVCDLAHDSGNENQKSCLRASSLQCLSAMVHQLCIWFLICLEECNLIAWALFSGDFVPLVSFTLVSGFGINSYVIGFSVARCGSWQSSRTFLLLLTRFVLLRKFNPLLLYSNRHGVGFSQTW